ncbi:MAG: hypothetical protein E6H91_01745 [Chloroflexi bacterium]|nr:MAG: hypothetical protein E6H91_01745 [Chloroflexota bacterium]
MSTTAQIYRWQVRARYGGNDPAIRAELLKRAGRVQDIGSGASYGDVLPELTSYVWVFPTKREGDDFARRLEGIDGVTVESASMGNRVLRDTEGRSTKADLLAGRQECVQCGAHVNPRDPQIVMNPFGLERGSVIRYDCRDCGMRNDIHIIDET